MFSRWPSHWWIQDWNPAVGRRCCERRHRLPDVVPGGVSLGQALSGLLPGAVQFYFLPTISYPSWWTEFSRTVSKVSLPSPKLLLGYHVRAMTYDWQVRRESRLLPVPFLSVSPQQQQMVAPASTFHPAFHTPPSHAVGWAPWLESPEAPESIW